MDVVRHGRLCDVCALFSIVLRAARRGNQTRADAERLCLTRTADGGPEPLERVEVSLGLEHAYLQGSHNAYTYIRLRPLGGAIHGWPTRQAFVNVIEG